MPLAKTALPVSNKPTPSPSSLPSQDSAYQYNGVPIDVFRQFGVELGTTDTKTIEKLRDIYEWSKDGSETMGDALIKISRLEQQLGMSGFDKRYDRVWNWVAITRKINDLDNRRNALRKQIWV